MIVNNDFQLYVVIQQVDIAVAIREAVITIKLTIIWMSKNESDVFFRQHSKVKQKIRDISNIQQNLKHIQTHNEYDKFFSIFLIAIGIKFEE